MFLDEPTTGFDPSARRGPWEMIEGLRELGKTVVLTTHYLEEAEQLADRIAVIAAGASSPRARPPRSATATARPAASPSRRRTDPARRPGRWHREAHGRWRPDRPRPAALLAELTAWALAAGDELRDLEVRRPSLEDVYLGLVQEAAA